MRTNDDLSLMTMLEESLAPMVSKIDQICEYPESFLKQLGEMGYYNVVNDVSSDMRLIEHVATVCGSTAFAIWCHVTGCSYVQRGESVFLKANILPSLERGELLGATGLSNPMKFYAGLEPLKLKARRVIDGVVCLGTLPFVSNLELNHWFGAVAEVSDRERVMFFVPCGIEG